MNNVPKLYPVWRKETKYGYQYLVSGNVPQNSICPQSISVNMFFVFYIAEWSLQGAAESLKRKLRELEPKLQYVAGERNRWTS